MADPFGSSSTFQDPKSNPTQGFSGFDVNFGDSAFESTASAKPASGPPAKPPPPAVTTQNNMNGFGGDAWDNAFAGPPANAVNGQNGIQNQQNQSQNQNQNANGFDAFGSDPWG